MKNSRNFTSMHSVKILAIALAFSMGLNLLIDFLVKDTTKATLLSMLSIQVCYIVATLFFVKKDQFEIEEIIPFHTPIYPLGILILLPIAVASILQNLFFAMSFEYIADRLNIGFGLEISLNSPVAIITAITIVAMMPALAEEIMFRGVILSSVRERGLWQGVFLSALVFSLTHMNFKQLVHPFLLGAILAYITLKTCNIIYAMIIHFLNNVIAMFLFEIPFFANLMVYSGKNLLILLGLMFAGASMLYPLIFLLLKATRSTRRQISYRCSKSPYEKASEKAVRKVDKPILLLCLALAFISIISTLLLAFNIVE